MGRGLEQHQAGLPVRYSGQQKVRKVCYKRFCTFGDAQSLSEHTAPMIPGLFRGTVLLVSCGQGRT